MANAQKTAIVIDASQVSVMLAGFLYVSQLSVRQMLTQKLDAITRALAIEYARDGIHVNTVAAGVIDTPMHKPDIHKFLKGLNPFGRLGEVKEIVDAVLCLTDATFTTGEILHVDGGVHAGKW